jgi:hypothetical protein
MITVVFLRKLTINILFEFNLLQDRNPIIIFVIVVYPLPNNIEP